MDNATSAPIQHEVGTAARGRDRTARVSTESRWRVLGSAATRQQAGEISLGLALVAIDGLYEAISAINARGVAVLLVEQSVRRSLIHRLREAAAQEPEVDPSQGTHPVVRPDHDHIGLAG